MTFRYFIFFAQVHEDFRLAELRSVTELYGFQAIKPSNLPGVADDEVWNPRRPFWIVDLESEEHARALAERCILVKSIYELYGHGNSYEEVHSQTRACPHLWECFKDNTPFRFTVTAYSDRVPMARQKDVVESFSFMDLRGKIDLKNPAEEFVCFEEYPDARYNAFKQKGERNPLLHIFFGRLLVEGKARALVQKFDVKQRAYYGNTTMESEISLLMANQTLASPGKFIYDPFIGTGSMAYTAAQFGAFFFGSDIDGRQMRGKGDTPGIMIAAKQYDVAPRIIDLCTFDMTNNPFRCGDIFDAIVTDPPYGVRAGAKRLGRKDSDRLKRLNNPVVPDPTNIPPTKPYELSDLVRDLIRLARHLLKPSGRLVFFLPTVTADYEPVDVEAALCSGMEVIANSVQDFGSWGRRLITIKKISSESFPSPFAEIETSGEDQEEPSTQHEPAHKDFREKYFRKFKKE